METAKVTSKGQMTIPKHIRERAHLSTGDTLVLDMENGRIVMRKLMPQEGAQKGAKDQEYLRSVQATLNEWSSPEDEEAWRDL
jgi:AbrB family looped-hinge helix DNA binding protein